MKSGDRYEVELWPRFHRVIAVFCAVLNLRVFF